MAHTEDLITLLAVAGRPVRVDEAAAALRLDPEEILQVTEQLVEQGHVLDTAEGIGLSADAPEPKSASRTSFLAGRWAEALDDLGGDPMEIGTAYLTAGQHQKAAEHLAPVALADGNEQAVEGALAAGEHGGFFSKVEEGQLRLSRAAHRRNRGETLGAAEDLEVAIRRLQGPDLVEALSFAAQVASDRQHPQQSEALAAMGAWQAAHIDDLAEKGLLLTLHGRELSRVGFPEESDRAIEVGRDLVDAHGNAEQKDQAHNNAAWVMFDRGEARRAEAEFATLRDHAQGGDEVTLGVREAYWARSLFGVGQAKEALDAAARADDLATKTGAAAPVFISGLARMEGSLGFGRYEDAVGHAEDVLEVIREALPAWENVALVGLARAYAGSGETEKAQEAVEAALEATPDGIDGWRWRIHAQEVQLSLTSESEDWPQRDAENLTDALLHARWFGSAAHLMGVRSHRESDKALGLEGAALALQIGNPMLAAHAVEAAEAWDDPAVVPVARAIQHLESHIPEDWMEEWRAHPAVANAFQVDIDVEEDSSALTEHIDEALKAAGLAGTDLILSPAQRQAKGLVRRRPRRGRRTIGLVAAAAAVVLLSGATAFAVSQLGGAEPVAGPGTTIATTTTLPSMEDTVVPLPERGVFGTVEYRGGAQRTGVFEFGGFRTPLGYYFEVTPGGSFLTDPLAYGRQLMFASTTPNAELVILNMGSDEANMANRINVSIGAQLAAAPAVQLVQQKGASGVALLVLGADDGKVYGRNALTGLQIWVTDVGGVVKGAPLIVPRESGPEIIVATDAGAVIGLDIDGNEKWRYEGSEENPLAGVDRPMAYHDDIVYVVDQEGVLHLLQLPESGDGDQDGSGSGVFDPSGGEVGGQSGDEATEEPEEAEATVELICDHKYGVLPPGAAPVISGGVVYIPLAQGEFWMTQAGKCNRQPSDRTTPQIVSTFQFGLQFAPIIERDIIYVVDNRRLVAIDARQNRQLDGVFNAGDPISGAPVMAGGVIYLGTQGGMVFAVDPTDRSEIWRFDVGEPIFGSPAVVKGGAVFVLTAEGTVVAIAVEE